MCIMRLFLIFVDIYKSEHVSDIVGHSQKNTHFGHLPNMFCWFLTFRHRAFRILLGHLQKHMFVSGIFDICKKTNTKKLNKQTTAKTIFIYVYEFTNILLFCCCI